MKRILIFVRKTPELNTHRSAQVQSLSLKGLKRQGGEAAKKPKASARPEFQRELRNSEGLVGNLAELSSWMWINPQFV